MCFFYDFKAGEYGKFYSSVDGLQVMEALKKFEVNRLKIKAIYDREDEQRKREEERQKHEREAISFEEWRSQQIAKGAKISPLLASIVTDE